MEVGASILKDLFPRGAMLICETWRVWELLTFRNDQGWILGWFRSNPKAGCVPPVMGGTGGAGLDWELFSAESWSCGL